MDKLKPCPFCGGEAYIDSFKSVVPSMPMMHVAKCKKCRAEINMPFRTELAAAAAWNRRTEKTGTWLRRDVGEMKGLPYCSECGYGDMDTTDYCPGCGANMEGETDG